MPSTFRPLLIAAWVLALAAAPAPAADEREFVVLMPVDAFYLGLTKTCRLAAGARVRLEREASPYGRVRQVRWLPQTGAAPEPGGCLEDTPLEVYARALGSEQQYQALQAR